MKRRDEYLREKIRVPEPDPPESRTPLLLGRLKHDRRGFCTIRGHLGDIRTFPPESYPILRLMDGFHSLGEISRLTGIPLRVVWQTFEQARGEKRLGFLEDWNSCYWCPNCALYLTSDGYCPACGSDTIQVSLRPPCDPWILFGDEYAFISEILKNQTGIIIDDKRLLLGNNGIGTNGFFWEIVYNGQVVITVDFAGLTPDTWQTAITDACHVVDWQYPYADVKIEALRLAEANEQRLGQLERNAIALVDEAAGYFATTPLLYFSGGKESVVMLRLLEKASLRANVLYVGTGVDFPEDAEFFCRELAPVLADNPLFYLTTNIAPAERFLGVFKERGALGPLSPWCREEIKGALKLEATRKLYGNECFVAFEGSRWHENDFRRSHPVVNFVEGYPNEVWVHPVAEWTGLDIWLYIFREDLRINPMYFLGFQRTTCWLCPIVNPFQLAVSKRRYPDLWKTIEGLRLEFLDGCDIQNTPF